MNSRLPTQRICGIFKVISIELKEELLFASAKALDDLTKTLLHMTEDKADTLLRDLRSHVKQLQQRPETVLYVWRSYNLGIQLGPFMEFVQYFTTMCTNHTTLLASIDEIYKLYDVLAQYQTKLSTRLEVRC